MSLTLLLVFLYSHPGYFGKKGQRHFHYNRNQYHCPTVNLDKLWTLVSEDARKASTEKKAAVIDVTKAVSFLLINNNRFLASNRDSSRSSARVSSQLPHALSVPRSSPRLLKSASLPPVVSASSSHERPVNPSSALLTPRLFEVSEH